MDTTQLRTYIEMFIWATQEGREGTKKVCIRDIEKMVLYNYLLNNNTGNLPVTLLNQAG
jgi:hypothetical protein